MNLKEARQKYPVLYYKAWEYAYKVQKPICKKEIDIISSGMRTIRRLLIKAYFAGNGVNIED